MNETSRENNVPYLKTTGDIRSILSDSARRAQITVREHPYFSAGVVAGIGITVVGLILLGTRRRKNVFERAFEWLSSPHFG